MVGLSYKVKVLESSRRECICACSRVLHHSMVWADAFHPSASTAGHFCQPSTELVSLGALFRRAHP